MADMPRYNLVTDEPSPQLRRMLGHNRVPPLPFTSDDKHLSGLEERVDSGVGYSLESQEFSSLSLEGERLSASDGGKIFHKQIQTCTSTASDSCPSVLQNQLRNLSIRDSEHTKESVKSNRCDSGICDSGDFSVEEPIIQLQAAFPECHLSSTVYNDNTFSVQELEELFSQDEDGDTPLHMSIILMLPDVALRILSLTPSSDCINLPNTLHQTPLHLAVATRQLWVARRLMGAGAAMEVPDHRGNTPLHMACSEGLMDMAQCLLTPVQHPETLANNYAISLQRMPQDLSLRNYDGFPCAHLALHGGHLDILQLLLDKGADINEQDGKSGRTLLHMAADLGDLKALHLLLRHRELNINAHTYGGLTAVSLAHGRGLSAVVELLYRVGADCSQLLEDSGESTDEEMDDCVYDDFCINGEPVQFS